MAFRQHVSPLEGAGQVTGALTDEMEAYKDKQRYDKFRWIQ